MIGSFAFARRGEVCDTKMGMAIESIDPVKFQLGNFASLSPPLDTSPAGTSTSDSSAFVSILSSR
jgi:hypothetical protein